MSIRRFSSSAEADRHDAEFWRLIPEAERVVQVWRLSLEVWQLRGDSPFDHDRHGFSLVISLTRR